MITKTDFRNGGAGDLVGYIQKNKGDRVPVKDASGRQLSEKEIDGFVRRSERAGFQRQFIIAPDPDAAVPPADLDSQTRETIESWRAEKPSVEYVYAVHREPAGKSHAHVAAIGRKRDLRMDREDLTSFRDLAKTTFRERERLASRSREQTRTREPTREVSRSQRERSGRSHGMEESDGN